MPERPADTGPLLAEITNAVVRLHRTHHGKGPNRSKSYLVDDMVVCVMQDIFTTIESTLIAGGEGDKVRATRLAVHRATAGEFTAAVEKITGRRVLSFTSQVMLDAGLEVVVFVLEPAAG